MRMVVDGALVPWRGCAASWLVHERRFTCFGVGLSLSLSSRV
jgi:hypothetical protein